MESIRVSFGMVLPWLEPQSAIEGVLVLSLAKLRLLADLFALSQEHRSLGSKGAYNDIRGLNNAVRFI